MKKILLTAFLMMILSACAPTSFDPNLSAIQSKQQAELYSAMATGTMQAFNAPLTEQSSASTQLAAQITQAAGWAQATNESGAVTQNADMTATAQYWTPTPNATSMIMEAQAMAMQTAIKLDTEKKQITNTFDAVIWPLFLVVVLIMMGIGIWLIVRDQRHKVLPSNVPGDKPIIINRVTSEVVDMDANPNYSTGKETSLAEQVFVQWMEWKYGFKPKHPQITEGRQDIVKARDQFIDLKARVAHLPKALTDAQSMKTLAEPTEQVSAGSDSFPLPAWNQLVTYPFQAGGDFPFGAFARELARIDVNKYPHLGVVGPTGCGKSRLFLRPFIASALASGNRVIVLGDMVDFVVFKMHPNATLVPVYQITKPEDAAQYVNALRVINSEMERRFEMLANQNFSTWERFGGENTLIVLDELGPNLDILDDTNPQAARSLRGFLSILISKGRKAGFNFVFASTRAVGLKKQLSQVSTIAFRLKDTDEERYAFGAGGFGAERLPDNYFLSKIGSSVRMTGSFNPNDQELGDFLLRHTTKALDKPTWIEGVFETPLSSSTPTSPQISANAEYLGGEKTDALHVDEARTKAGEIIEMAEKIRGRWNIKMTKSDVSRLFDKEFAGTSWCKRINDVIDYLASTTTTPTLEKPYLGHFQGL